MYYSSFRLQALNRLSGQSSNYIFRSLATRANVNKVSAAKKITWGISGALLTAGVAGIFSSTILLEAENPILFKDGSQKLTNFNSQSSALQVDQTKLSQEFPGIFLWGANE